MASRYRPLPVHSGSAQAQCLGSTAQGHTYKHKETCLYSLIRCHVLTSILGGKVKNDSLFTEGVEGGEMEKESGRERGGHGGGRT